MHGTSRPVSGPETPPASLSPQSSHGALASRGAEASQRLARKDPKRAASLVARIHRSPSPPISTYLSASNHRSGRAVVGGKRSRCFWAAISRGPSWARRSRHKGRTRAGSAARSLQRLLVVAMVRRKRRDGVSRETERARGCSASLGLVGGSRLSHSSA